MDMSHSFLELPGVISRVIECGREHTLCLTLDGKIFGIGRNEECQLGTGGATNSERTPVQTNIYSYIYRRHKIEV